MNYHLIILTHPLQWPTQWQVAIKTIYTTERIVIELFLSCIIFVLITTYECYLIHTILWEFKLYIIKQIYYVSR